jgi:hypothetical protein
MVEQAKPQPITPQQVIDHYTDLFRAEELEKAVFFINGILTAPESVLALNNGKEVEVFDSSGSQTWIILGAEAVKLFQKEGWYVMTTTEPHHYMFKMPQRRGGSPVKTGEKA